MIKVRWAEAKDLYAVKQIADNNRKAIGFVRRVQLLERIRHQGLLVCENDGQIVGFVSFRHRRDGWTVIYEVCVEKAYRRRGIGRALIAKVQEEALNVGQIGVRLKCPIDLPANGFYAKMGFTRLGLENGKRRPLVIWESGKVPSGGFLPRGSEAYGRR